MSARTGRRAFMSAVGGALTRLALPAQSRSTPNIVLILADDLGYGDVGCYGSPLPTPNLNRMAEEGVRMERAYSASPVCSPSRAALLTGRYPGRCGLTNVLMPWSTDGLPPSERTLPKLLRERSYRTACIGKWHLGTTSECLPNSAGFDEFFGVPYSNDMAPPLLRNTDMLESRAPQPALTERFTAEAVEFIGRNQERPFFLYLAHTAPHIPLAPSARFREKSGHGEYGDVVSELDSSTGEVLDALKQRSLDENTLVIFTSDNGPWYQGSAGRLQGRKGSTYEGGVRVPFIARFPGRIPAGKVSTALSSLMDVTPTVAALTGRATTHTVDGVDIWPVLSGERHYIEREVLLFFDRWHIQCVRWGPWKLHVARYNSYPWTADPPGGRYNLPLNSPELYHIDNDPTESYDRASGHPDVVRELQAAIDRLLPTFPEQVRAAWRDTLRQPVIGAPAGALPGRQP